MTNPNHDLFDMYFEYTQHTEPPPIFHRWSLISTISALMGRNTWLDFGHQRIYPNQYIMLTGGPGSRKSTALGIAKDLAMLADYRTFAYSSTTAAKFLLDFAAGFDIKEKTTEDALSQELFADKDEDKSKPAECWVATGEFNTFIGHGDIGFIANLTDLWDCPPCADVRTKTSGDFRINKPTLNILGGNTPTGLSQSLPAEVIGQGFLSRVLLIYGGEGKRVTWPPPPDPALRVALVQRLHRIRSAMCGCFQFDDAAREYLDVVYKSTRPLEDVRFEAFHSRRFTHLLKLCMVVAAARMSMTVSVKDAVYANTILAHAELDMPKALGQLGASRNAETVHRVYDMLLSETIPLTPIQIYQRCSTYFDRPSQVGEVIQSLSAAGKVKTALMPDGRGNGFVAIKQERDTSRENLCDFHSLYEFKERENAKRSAANYLVAEG